MRDAQLVVTIAALAAGAICFGLYVYGTIVAVWARADAVRSAPLAQSADPALSPRSINVDDIGRLADALSKLTDSLSRASPALTGLVGALVFFAIAAVSSGALRG